MDSETGTPTSFCMARSLASCSGFNQNATFFIMRAHIVSYVYTWGQQYRCRLGALVKRVSILRCSLSGTISQTRSNNVSGALEALFFTRLGLPAQDSSRHGPEPPGMAKLGQANAAMLRLSWMAMGPNPIAHLPEKLLPEQSIKPVTTERRIPAR